MQDLIQLTFVEPAAAKSFAEYFTARIRPEKSVKGTVKTLKSLRQLTMQGSRSFRTELRKHDEILRATTRHSVKERQITGQSQDEAIIKLAKVPDPPYSGWHKTKVLSHNS